MHSSQSLRSFSKKKRAVQKQGEGKQKGRDDGIRHLWAEAGSPRAGQRRPLLPFNFDGHAVDVFILKQL